MIVYHGTTSKFDHFDLAHLGEGEGKSKFGVGHYASSVYDTAALYAGKCKGKTKYVYTLEVPDLTDTNHIVSAKPPHLSIIEKVEEQIGQIPDEAKSSGKYFRKYIGNLLLGNKGTVKKMIGSLSTEGEIKVSKFLYETGVLYLVWAQSQATPDNGKINIAILDDNIIKIEKIETAELVLEEGARLMEADHDDSNMGILIRNSTEVTFARLSEYGLLTQMIRRYKNSQTRNLLYKEWELFEDIRINMSGIIDDFIFLTYCDGTAGIPLRSERWLDMSDSRRKMYQSILKLESQSLEDEEYYRGDAVEYFFRTVSDEATDMIKDWEDDQNDGSLFMYEREFKKYQEVRQFGIILEEC